MSKAETLEIKPPKDIFADILNATDVDPLVKYANLHLGVNPNELASIDQAKAFVPYVDKLIKSDPLPIGLASPVIIAIPSGMQTTVAHSIPVDQIIEDGFPSDKKIHLFLYFEGPKSEEEGEVGDDKCINVALAVRKYFGVPPGIAGNPAGLLVDIKG